MIPVEVLRPQAPVDGVESQAFDLAYIAWGRFTQTGSRSLSDEGGVDTETGADTLELTAWDPDITTDYRLRVQGREYRVVGSRPLVPFTAGGQHFVVPVA